MNVWPLSGEGVGEVPAGTWAAEARLGRAEARDPQDRAGLAFPGVGWGSVTQWQASGTPHLELFCIPRRCPTQQCPFRLALTTMCLGVWEHPRVGQPLWLSAWNTPRPPLQAEVLLLPCCGWGPQLGPLVCRERHLQPPLRGGVPRGPSEGMVMARGCAHGLGNTPSLEE